MLQPGIFGIRFRYAIFMGCARCALACLAFLCLFSCRKEKPAVLERAPEVEVAQVVQRDVPIVHEWVGTADGLVNATIRAQVTGYLIRQDYVEGDMVRRDQVLFETDPRPFQAALHQAEGTLAQMEALYENARANLSRVKPLAAKNALSKKDLDDAVAAKLGYEVTMVRDATADYSDEEMHAALEVNIPNYATAVVSTHEAVEAIASL